MAIGRTDDRNNPRDPVALRRRDSVREPIGVTHLGQRSPPTAQTGRTHDRNRPDPSPLLNPCNPGAVHTWIPAFAGMTRERGAIPPAAAYAAAGAAFSIAAWALATIAANASGSRIARSDNTLRSMSMPASFTPCMNCE
jgi:hypothetical protein